MPFLNLQFIKFYVIAESFDTSSIDFQYNNVVFITQNKNLLPFA